MQRICRKYDIFKVFSLENGGVSATRNFGIEHSQGQYITYLDSDDTLTDNTLKTVADFFDRHFDEIDLVTYKIVPYYGEQKFALHYRYKLLKKTGVYDLEDPEYCYITQTTMNICVKNLGEGKNVFSIPRSHSMRIRNTASMFSVTNSKSASAAARSISICAAPAAQRAKRLCLLYI